MKFKIYEEQDIPMDRLILHKDESIISEYQAGDYVLHLATFTFGLLVDKSTKRVLNFVGYSSDFVPTDNLTIPKSKKGKVFLDEILKPNSDGDYYNKFCAKGFYDKTSGWYSVGDDSVIDDVIEISKDTFLNIVNGDLRTVYFKPFVTTQ